MFRSRLVKRLTAVGAGAALAVVGLAVPVAGAAPAQASGKCPINALKNAKSKPVEITYWQGGFQRANREVWPLRQHHDALAGRHRHAAATERPDAGDGAEQRRFTRARGAGDQRAFAVAQGERVG